ncbi:hypothetical protein [Ruegeria faecimaris]|uniref:hypothetical protein n=1 Tax=Ruegeria faecimaris TaxID=686389 RepID=UPI0024935CEF|nr:hypothetical protein [Ruegeria faecimaris]
MIKHFLSSVLVSILVISAKSSEAQEIHAMVCHSSETAPFFVTLSEESNGPIARINDGVYQYEINGGEVTLGDLPSKTLMIISEMRGKISVNGLLDGQVVIGECTNAKEPFLEALRSLKPRVKDELVSLETQLRVVQEEATAIKEQYDQVLVSFQQCDAVNGVGHKTELDIMEDFVSESRSLMVSSTELPDDYRQKYNEMYFSMLRLLDRPLRR